MDKEAIQQAAEACVDAIQDAADDGPHRSPDFRDYLGDHYEWVAEMIAGHMEALIRAATSSPTESSQSEPPPA